MTTKDPLAPFLDDDGRLTCLPQKHAVRRALLALLAEKFAPGQDYTEKQVNAICDAWHTFGDYFVLRRRVFAVVADWLGRRLAAQMAAPP